MTEREKIRYRRKVEREIKVQIYKDIIAVILMLLFFISPYIFTLALRTFSRFSIIGK